MKELLHSCAPPQEAMDAWLTATPKTSAGYGHLLLEQNNPVDPADLRPYFESAHQDARQVFHSSAGMDMHPDAAVGVSHALYPACLPPKARRGLFGEVLTGLVTQQYGFVGDHEWSLPVFLFRHHSDARAYVHALAREPKRQRETFGRHGNDFIAVCLDDTGAVVRFLAGEAKWRASLTPSSVAGLMDGDWVKDSNPRQRSGRGIWFEINREVAAPDGLRQLQGILADRDPEGFAQAILSLDRALLINSQHPIPRTDLILLSGNRSTTWAKGATFLPTDAAPGDYTAGNDLQVIEVIIAGGEAMIDALYASLWSQPNGA